MVHETIWSADVALFSGKDHVRMTDFGLVKVVVVKVNANGHAQTIEELRVFVCRVVVVGQVQKMCICLLSLDFHATTDRPDARTSWFTWARHWSRT